MNKFLKFLVPVFFVITTSCNAQVKNENILKKEIELINLKPAFAGQFYPLDQSELQKSISDLFANAETKKVNNLIALIVPHAGYVFSGEVAASGYNQIDPDKRFDNIFIIASSHRMYFEGASIFSRGNCETPLGEIMVNKELANLLIDENKIFIDHPDAFISEHSIEVQLPFLQSKLNTEFKIIPIVIGSQSVSACKKIANALKPYFNEKNLFIISSDFSHYPEYTEAIKWDKLTADAILTNNPDEFLNSINDSEDDKVPNLSTRACGWTSILTLLYMTENKNPIKFSLIDYKNSGESIYGSKDKVVGYHSIAAYLNPDENLTKNFSLSDSDKRELLNIARKTIIDYIDTKHIASINQSVYSNALKENCGAFVTLNKNNKLRGCIGRFEAEQPLYEVVQQMAIAASTQDLRFPPVSINEVNDLEIEISVLSPLKRINSIDEITLGKHGIYIRKGHQKGTFLPQVANETKWSIEEFLGHCSRDKAGIGWDGWKDAELYIYEAIVFSENDFKQIK